MTAILHVKSLRKAYGETPVLSDVGLTLHKGEIACLIGPSGGGKTTLLRCLGLLEDIDDGKIVFPGHSTILPASDEQERKIMRPKIGTVFQDFHLWPHKTVLENIIEPLTLVKRLSLQEAERKAFSLLEKVGLRDKALSYPDFLSGGQKQRAAIARTLAMEPEILLLDEITSSLDPELVSSMFSLIKQLAREGQTMLLVTHHMDFAAEIADRMLFMDKGKIVEEGKPDEVIRNPKSKRLKEFLRSV